MNCDSWTNDAVAYFLSFNLRAFAQNGMIDVSVKNFSSGKGCVIGIERPFFIIAVKKWFFGGKGDVGIVEGFDGANVFPVTLMNKGCNVALRNFPWNEVFAKSSRGSLCKRSIILVV